MIIRKYGIILRRLKKEDIELVRNMRNSVTIQERMVYREHITPEMQERWFASVNNKYNGYFIIEADGKKVGLIHGKNLDYEKRTCEGGIFIWDESYNGSQIPSFASVIMNDLTFYMINFNIVYARVLKNNEGALSYNKLMGYVPCEPLSEDEGVEWLMLTRDSYEKHITPLRQGIKQITGDGDMLKLEDGDASDDLGEEVKLFYMDLPPDIQEKADMLLAKAREKRDAAKPLPVKILKKFVSVILGFVLVGIILLLLMWAFTALPGHI
jgi:RimJ/RimL family protein N-acetyltransferase